LSKIRAFDSSPGIRRRSLSSRITLLEPDARNDPHEKSSRNRDADPILAAVRKRLSLSPPQHYNLKSGSLVPTKQGGENIKSC